MLLKISSYVESIIFFYFRLLSRQYSSDTKLNFWNEPNDANKLTKRKEKFRRFSNSIQLLSEFTNNALYIDSNYSDALEEV